MDTTDLQGGKSKQFPSIESNAVPCGSGPLTSLNMCESEFEAESSSCPHSYITRVSEEQQKIRKRYYGGVAVAAAAITIHGDNHRRQWPGGLLAVLPNTSQVGHSKDGGKYIPHHTPFIGKVTAWGHLNWST